MIPREIKGILTAGLLGGYIGDTNIQVVQRGTFSVKSSDYQSNEGRYHDEWIGKRSGGGQEIIEVNGEKYTRLYAGSCLDEAHLRILGIGKSDIDAFRTEAIKVAADQTRLDQTFDYQSKDGQWNYGYDVDDEFYEQFNLIRGLEQINFRGERVLVHTFMQTPIE